MYRPVRRRTIQYAEKSEWNTSSRGRRSIEKDGYEIYFFTQNDGFELTIRNPETMERETVFEVRNNDIPTSSPHYVALLRYVIDNAEQIVIQCLNEQ